MDSVRDILEVFGAIDRAVRTADDPHVTAAADKLMPGLATANPNWYTEIETRFFGDNARRTPNLAAALQRIADDDADPNTGRLTPAQKARLLYGISAQARLKAVASGSLPTLDDSDAQFDTALTGSLAAITPREVTDVGDRRAQATAGRDQILNTAASNFIQAQDFDGVVRTATVGSAIRNGKPMSAPLCQTAVVVVDGYPSVIVDTKFTSGSVSLEQVKNIVNPFNWNEDYNELFVAMQAQTPNTAPDGWRRVLETVHLLGPIEATTPLKFFPSLDAKGLTARLDYDLDMSNFDAGDGQVRVDHGFINMKSTAGDPSRPGVRVTTRKVVHIEGISAFAQARLVCIGGYGTASADFLLGSAAAPPPNPAPFDYPTKPDQPDPTEKTSTAPPRATPMTHFVPAGVDAWTECAQDLTNGYFDVAQKWLSGSLTLTDLSDYTTRVSGQLATTPWKYLQAMTTPRTPGQPGGAK